VKPFDKVFTIDGTLQNIKRVYCDHYSGKVLNLKIANDYESIKVTQNHPFYVIKNQNGDNLKERLERKLVIPEWIEASKITVNDLIGFPIPQYFNDNPELDEVDCYIYGLMLGCSSNELVLEKNQDNLIQYMSLYLKKYGIQYKINTDNKYIISWEQTSKFKFISSQYNEFDSMLLHLPRKKAEFILEGIFDKYGNKIINESKNIIDGIKFLLLKIGRFCKTYMKDNKYVLEELKDNYFEYEIFSL
jgi:intein/homing endonuclease